MAVYSPFYSVLLKKETDRDKRLRRKQVQHQRACFMAGKQMSGKCHMSTMSSLTICTPVSEWCAIMTETIKERGRTRLRVGRSLDVQYIVQICWCKRNFQISRGLKGIRVFVTMYNLLRVSVPQHHETIVKL